jgi:GT2 family glycosyltransferase
VEAQAPIVPPVVAVLVTRDPGPWFDEVLDGLAAQDYPNLSVLVIDSGSTEDPSARIGARLPGAYVRRLPEPVGYGPAANHALQLVQGAAFLCLLHDDVALDPGAVRLLVEEAYRSNAGIAGPKLVEWDDPRRLQSVGGPIDKTGVPAVVVHPGELDQEQHDAVQDVFVLSGACLLVRGDLFTALRGFDDAIDLVGEDLDLCWRAHVVGARVVAVPAARARHRQDLAARVGDVRLQRLGARHRLRTFLSAYSLPHLVRVVPQLLVLHVVLVVGALLRGRPRAAGDVVAAWRWNLARLGSLRSRRRALRAARQVPDAEIRNLQVRGSAQLSAILRDQLERRDDRVAVVQGAGRSVVGAMRSGERRASFGAWIAIVAAFLLGSRHLIRGDVPSVGDLLPYPDAARTLLGEYLSAWRGVGLGQRAPAPTGMALLGLFGLPFFGQLGLARTVLVLGPVLLGLVGAWRLTRPIGIQAARVTCLVAAASLPVAWNALAAGRWTGLLAFGAAPWVLARLARATQLAPFGPVGVTAGPGTTSRSFVTQAAGLGLLTALVTAFEPLFPLLVLLVAGGLVLGSVVAGGVAAALRALGLAGASVGVTLLLHLPWSFEAYHPDTTWAVLGGIPRAAPPDRGALALLGFHTGPVGGGWLVLGVVAAAAYALLAAEGWRWAWAVRSWGVALLCFGVAVLDDRGVLPRPLPGPEVLLAPAGIALALAVGLGAAAFVEDVRGQVFSWKHVLGFVSLAAVVVGTLPSLGATVDGRWGLPSSDLDASLDFLRLEQDEGRFRVLWLGDPDVVPVPGFWLSDGLTYALADEGATTCATGGRPPRRMPTAWCVTRCSWPAPGDRQARATARALRREVRDRRPPRCPGRHRRAGAGRARSPPVDTAEPARLRPHRRGRRPGRLPERRVGEHQGRARRGCRGGQSLGGLLPPGRARPRPPPGGRDHA